jgi:hypothetical protein
MALANATLSERSGGQSGIMTRASARSARVIEVSNYLLGDIAQVS